MEIPKEIEKDYNSFLNALYWLETNARVFEDYINSLYNVIDAIHEDMDAMEYVAKADGEPYHALYQFFRKYMVHDTSLMQIGTKFMHETESLNSTIAELGKIEHRISKTVKDKA